MPSSFPLERVTGLPEWLPLVRVVGPVEEVEGVAPLVRVLTGTPGVEAVCEPLVRVATAPGVA
ncbi:MAG: hypothetical protein ACTHQQ_14265 [Solirubrobacteraceae bacterium]